MGRLTDRYYDVTNKKWHWSIKSNSTNDGLVATPQDILDKLAHYEDMEEQGLLIKLDLNQYKRDDLDRCTHRHCNNCDKYRRELQEYKDLEEAEAKLKELEPLPVLHGNTLPNSKEEAMKRLGLESNELKELEGDKDGR